MLGNMKVTVIPIVVGDFETFPKVLEKTERTGDQRKNRDLPDYSTFKIR